MYKYNEIIKAKNVDVDKLSDRTKRAIKKYEKLSALPKPNQEELDDLNEVIVNDIVSYLSSTQQAPTKNKKGMISTLHDFMYGD